MKTLGLIMFIVGAFLAVVQIKNVILREYNYEKKYTQAWELADKSSTIPAKQKYIQEFLTALQTGKERGDFASHDAMFLKTPNNSFDANLKALQTLAERLTQIQSMNPSSFEYNTAIQQITAQEQGLANEMLGVFKGCYTLNNYFFIWDWVGVIILLVTAVLIIVGGVIFLVEVGWLY